MIISIDTRSLVPPYEQVRAQVAEHVTAGGLVPGSRLPTVRQLAKDLGLAANTVARAYRELERTGVVVSRGRHGTFVTEPARDGAGRAEASTPVDDTARRLVTTARDAGLTRADVLRLVERFWSAG